MAIKIQKFKAVLSQDGKEKSVTMRYAKGVLLRTAWRDAILHFHRNEEILTEGELVENSEYSITVIPMVVGESEPQIVEED